MQVHTVGGSISSDELGITLMHEHIYPLFEFSHGYGRSKPHREVAFNYVVNLLKQVRKKGVDTIVDCTAWGGKERIKWFLDAAEQAGIQIIATTGYFPTGTELVPPDFDLSKKYTNYTSLSEKEKTKSVEEIADTMVRDVREGIEGTSVKAGAIKVAASKANLTPWERKTFIAAAKAQREVNVPIITHAVAGARNQLEVLLGSGADPNHCCFSHVQYEPGWENRSLDEEAKYLAQIAQRGVFFHIDGFGFEFESPKEHLSYLLHYLKGQGYSHKILIGTDANMRFDENGRIELEKEAKHPSCREREYSYLFTHAIPWLYKEGFIKEDIDQWLKENPKHMFEM